MYIASLIRNSESSYLLPSRLFSLIIQGLVSERHSARQSVNKKRNNKRQVLGSIICSEGLCFLDSLSVALEIKLPLLHPIVNHPQYYLIVYLQTRVWCPTNFFKFFLIHPYHLASSQEILAYLIKSEK